MKKYLIILLMAILPTLALAQQPGGHITRPSKPATTTTKPPKKQVPPKKQTTSKPAKKQTPPKKQSTTKPPKKQSGSTHVDTRPAMQNKTFTVGGVSFTMVAVEGGTFTMGATNEQGSDAYVNEKPAHSVTLSSYYIGQTEVTQELWQAVMGSNPSRYKGARRPVEMVSWDDCQEFMRKLNSLTGQSFKLPTEAQWEFAARGGRKSRGYKYSGSNDIGAVAWYRENSYDKGSNSPDYITHNVATKQANELSIYDMSGNVFEWCSDWYGNYSSGSQTNPVGSTSGSHHVSRGGCYGIEAKDCRVSKRFVLPMPYNHVQGLRLAL